MGKMTVGRAICAAGGFGLFHNHMTIEPLNEPFGDDVAFVELRADMDTRLERNHTEHQLAEKRSKRDLAWSDANVREMEQQFQMTSTSPSMADEILGVHPHLVLDNTDLTPDQAAERVLDRVATLDSRS